MPPYDEDNLNEVLLAQNRLRPPGLTGVPPQALNGSPVPPMALPPDRPSSPTPDPDLTQLPPMYGGVPPSPTDTLPLPPQTQVPKAADMAPAPPPPAPPPPSAYEQFRKLVENPPKEDTGWRRHVEDYFEGGVPGLALGFIDKHAEERKRYNQLMKLLPIQQQMEHTKQLEENAKLEHDYQRERLADVKEQRGIRNEDRDLDREVKMSGLDLEAVQPGVPEPMGQPGDTGPRYENVQIGGKTYRRPSKYGRDMAAQEAKERDWLVATPFMAQQYGKWGVKEGQRISPALQAAIMSYEQKTEGRKPTAEEERSDRRNAVETDPYLKNLNQRDKEVYIATGHIERPASVNVSLQRYQDERSNRNTLAEELANGNLSRLKDLTGTRSGDRIAVFNEVNRIRRERGQPAYSTSEIDRQIEAADYYANKKGADNLRSFDIFLQHAGNAVDALNASKNISPQILNMPLNAIRQKYGPGNPEYVRLQTAIEPALNEYLNFLKNNHATFQDEERRAHEILNGNISVANGVAALREMAHVADARLRAEDARYSRNLGKSLGAEFLSQQAKDNAKKLGVTVFGAAPGGPEGGGGGGGGNQKVFRKKVKDKSGNEFEVESINGGPWQRIGK